MLAYATSPQAAALLSSLFLQLEQNLFINLFQYISYVYPIRFLHQLPDDQRPSCMQCLPIYLTLTSFKVTYISLLLKKLKTTLQSPPLHPLLQDIAVFLQDCSIIIVRHVYREANSAVDWIDSYIAYHTGEVWWTFSGMPRRLCVIFFFPTLSAVFFPELFVKCTNLQKKKKKWKPPCHTLRHAPCLDNNFSQYINDINATQKGHSNDNEQEYPFLYI